MQSRLDAQRLTRSFAGLAAIFLFTAASPWLTSAQAKFTVLYSFKGGTDGATPAATLILDKTGHLLGTTVSGGNGNGTVFKLSKDGTESVIYAFAGGKDAAYPSAPLLLDSSGNLYGATWHGGSYGYGAVFDIAPDGAETVIYSFSGGDDGAYPSGGLVIGKSGTLYGTTHQGGANGVGTAFQLKADGRLKVLHTFSLGGADGSLPRGGLIKYAGNFYGVTETGGAFNCGTIFKLAPDGAETVLHSFTLEEAGAYAWSAPIADSEGNLYTTLPFGGGYQNGAVFKLAPDGTASVMHSFTGGSQDGSDPESSVVLDLEGNLYGTTYYGGAKGDCKRRARCGTVFKLTSGGTSTLLHKFQGAGDGEHPVGGLVASRKGLLYGTTFYGGLYGYGTVFKLSE